jgi:alanine dehydrogenase
MNIGLIRERAPFDRRVALTPPVVRRLTAAGHTVWAETGAGDGAMFGDPDYLRAGAQIAYAPEEVLGRIELLAKIGRPTELEISRCIPETAILAFYHMAVADRGFLDLLAERRLTAIGCEVIQQDDGGLPVLAAISEIAGQMTVPIAAHMLRSSSGGSGILLGGTPGMPGARVVVLGGGAAGFAAARTAAATGARVIVFDRNPKRLLHLQEHLPAVDTVLADEEAIAQAVETADAVIAAILVAGARPPHVVTREMVERMKPGSAIIDVSIDQGGCVETSRPTTIAEPTFAHKGVNHFCVPNFTADLGRSASVAIAQAMLPYVLTIAKHGITEALAICPDLKRGVCTLRGSRP